ncbi:uncharacterized protein DUF222 [Haloactinopolyspora alba]|uniref:Uncharacterized protein DUF222 n=1 Tax=Haloactinopolyspora alba TaxID=648780 RepID=A0A2P8EFU1_9ACTN|nr:HNH endonuclease signature motif containing protein [Haloactinopolyspora alba]PSL08329.1 uncharacterized protein DUF222 [Haloactinopolyspora alba]
MIDDEDPPGPVAELASHPPGPDLAELLSGLEVGEMSTHDLVAAIQATERQKSHDEAAQIRLLAELARRPEYQRCSCPVDADTGHEHRAVEPAGDEVSLAMSWSPGRARDRVALAAELTDELPHTAAALRSGALDLDKARLIADRTRCLADVELRRRVEAVVLASAATRTRTQLDHRLRHEVITIDPATAEQRRRRAKQRRHVTRPRPATDGATDQMASMELHGPAEDLAALWTALDAAARHARAEGDARTLDGLRFDILTGLGWTGLELGHLGCCNPACTGAESHPLARRHGKAATVQVTVALSTLIGVDEQPGRLDGFGPVTAEVSRRVSAEGPWRRLLTDPAHGRLLEYGRDTYAPPAELASFVAARDRTCRFPTCDRPARDADIDHIRPFDQGGTTDAVNTWSLHDGHHFGKTHHDFTAYIDSSGEAWWVTPAGRCYPASAEMVGPLISNNTEGAHHAAETPPF